MLTKLHISKPTSLVQAEPLAFDMLNSCHERVERMLSLLSKIEHHVATHGADVQAQQAAHDVMRYFDMAAPLHHQDEELHVFPAVLRSATAPLQQAVAQLIREHRSMEQLWMQLRASLDSLYTSVLGQAFRFDAAQLAVCAQFKTVYAQHLVLENQMVYPAARVQLNPKELDSMGQEMMHRRGVRPVQI